MPAATSIPGLRATRRKRPDTSTGSNPAPATSCLQIPKSGINLPNMGTKPPVKKISEAAARYAGANLSDALFTTTQQRVLAHLFGEPGRAYSVSELIQATGSGSGAVQRELAKLAGSGLLTVQQVGNQKRYQANREAPIYDEIVSIVRKTFGLASPLRKVLAPLADRINAAFVYGSVAKSRDAANSDIDLMVVADELSYPDVMGALHPVSEQLGREINPTLYTRAELQKRINADSSFITRVLRQPRIWLIGADSDLGA